MPDLSPTHFSAYFLAVHGHEPFPWQQRLAEQVAADGRWPDFLDLPTGSGKTAAIDVAVFHLALEAGRRPSERRAPLRVAMVVDRRTVVDQAYERARHIAHVLRDARDGVLANVRDRLCSISSTGEPLALAHLRGGMPREDSWAKRPDQPLVAVSTVDQVGSRLLFRGYGVSDTMRPIHAGLLANDTLLLLDEVHLSRAFLATLDSVRRYREGAACNLPNRWQAVAMSATPGEHARQTFRLADADRNHPRLSRRLRARKPAASQLVKVSGTEAQRRGKFAQECAARAHALAKGGRAVGVVVNRVATALEICRIASSAKEKANVLLLTGRMRALDRADMDKELAERVSSGRSRTEKAEPLIVVATQCIEAGADFDFDALVTECASLDALRQRFGRLNRLGLAEEAEGMILVRSDSIGERDVDPVYGKALGVTWSWLTEAERDFGIEAMESALPRGEALAPMLPPQTRAPVMLPSHLDAWSQTAPVPRPDPDVSFWLHGIQERPQVDVQLVWRGDITERLLKCAAGQYDPAESESISAEAALAAAIARVEVCAPTSLETLSLPIAAARAWLAGSVPPDIADVEGASLAEGSESRDQAKLALSWKGDASTVVTADDLRPGMTLVVPSSYGGLSRGTWDPTSRTPVTDLGDRARWQRTGRPTLRLHRSVLPDGFPVPEPSNDESQDDREVIATWLEKISDKPELTSWLGEIVAALTLPSRRSPSIVRLDDVGLDADGAGYFAIVGRARAKKDGGGEISTEDDGASLTGVEVSLDAHMRGVADWARQFVAAAGLPESLARDVELAARWHDAGKADPRFQRMLRGGSPLADVAREPLAKSRMLVADRAERIRARERSGYPKGARHELSSVALLQKEGTLLRAAADPELVLHLVASHHGWCRPFAPVVEDREPVDVRLEMAGALVEVSSSHGLDGIGSGVAARYWRLVQRYGWFGLAWLEAILRLADHRRSEAEQARSERKEGT